MIGRHLASRSAPRGADHTIHTEAARKCERRLKELCGEDGAHILTGDVRSAQLSRSDYGLFCILVVQQKESGCTVGGPQSYIVRELSFADNMAQVEVILQITIGGECTL